MQLKATQDNFNAALCSIAHIFTHQSVSTTLVVLAWISLLIFLKIASCIGLCVGQSERDRARWDNQLRHEPNRKLYWPATLQLRPDQDPLVTRIHSRIRLDVPLLRSKNMPHPADLMAGSDNYQSVRGGWCLQFWQFWHVEQHLKRWARKKWPCMCQIVTGHRAAGGSGVKLAKRTLSNFWITLKDMWRLWCDW